MSVLVIFDKSVYRGFDEAGEKGVLVGEIGKEGVSYCYRGGIALETQFYPNSVNNPQWVQPFTKAGERYHTVTEYRFS